jgi:hypothetical protein
MTCFWNGILSQLGVDDFKFLGEPFPPISRKKRIQEFIHLLQRKCVKMTDVLWQGERIRELDIKESHLPYIREYPVNLIGRGHDTGTCDSFLLLICQLFHVDIEHRYLGSLVKYQYLPRETTIGEQSRKTLSFTSNRGHFAVWRRR